MNNILTLSCPCHFGLESVLSGEAKRLGFTDLQTENGRVSFIGGEKELIRANLWLRTAERVQIILGKFTALTFTELFDQVEAIPFEDFISPSTEFPVTGYCLNSQLASIPDCQSIIKKAIAKRLGQLYHTAWLPEDGSKVRVQFGIIKDVVSIYLDTSGAGLHKRGYRRLSTEAPIKETLAAGIIDLARVYPDSQVYDPFCGSGTFLIEAGLKALDIAPGINRKFQYEEWGIFSPTIIADERKLALDKINRSAPFHAFGSDIDSEAVYLSEENAKKAGISKKASFTLADIAKFKAPEGRAVVFANPPYGERLLDEKQAINLYRTMGKVFVPKDGVRYYIISSHPHFEKFFGRPADKRRKLYNGNIKCQLFMYFR